MVNMDFPFRLKSKIQWSKNILGSNHNGIYKKDDVDARGRWKSNKRIVDTVIDCLIPFPDAKVASTLCIRGLVKYVVREEFSNLINDNLILQLTGSNITNLFPR